VARWLHIYVSMFGLAAVLFFSVTGITLNHPDWFLKTGDHSVRSEGQVNRQWLGTTGDPAQVAKLEIVEHLRAAHGVRAALSEFRVDDGECLVAFRGPAYAADAFIERESGRYSLTQTYHGAIALINDLHKGRDTGPVWSVVIDVSAALLILISVTGLILLFYLKMRRVPGLVVALVGTVAVAVVVAMVAR
jgi:hypothetical protein